MAQPRKYPLFTIGYEGVTVDALVKTLVDAKVTALLDVRAVPLSRKPGFSKNKLAARLAEAGIAYIGLKGLGTPAEGRDAARKGRIAEMRRIFMHHLATPQAVDELAEAVRLSAAGRACLLCFEHDASCCHRLLVAEEMAKASGTTIEHLNPGLPDLV